MYNQMGTRMVSNSSALTFPLRVQLSRSLSLPSRTKEQHEHNFYQRVWIFAKHDPHAPYDICRTNSGIWNTNIYIFTYAISVWVWVWCSLCLLQRLRAKITCWDGIHDGRRPTTSLIAHDYAIIFSEREHRMGGGGKINAPLGFVCMRDKRKQGN